MQINPRVPYISRADLEDLADSLLVDYQQEIEAIIAPPVPVEKIADFLLELNLEWLDIQDTDEEPILAYLQPREHTIRLNERRMAYFDDYPGTYEYTLAHEIGHYQLHLIDGEGQSNQLYLCRFKQKAKDRREWQAEQFASYLLMPESLLIPALEGVKLYHWTDLYRLRDRFKVSITALRIRLESLGLLHVTPNGRLYPDKDAAANDQQLEIKRLVSQGQLYNALGEIARTREVYQQALEIAQAQDDRRNEAFLAWNLGRLYIQTELHYAVALMSICVSYEREVGHPQAEADAAYVEQLKQQLVTIS